MNLSRPPIASSAISVVLAADNAAADLEDVVRAWVKLFDDLKRSREILLVDDGSTDGSAARADALAGMLPQVRVFHHPERRGLGAALRTGIEAAKHPLLFFTRCTKQFQPDDLKRMLEHIDGADVVTGYRVSGPIPTWLARIDVVCRYFWRVVFGWTEGEARDCWLGMGGWTRRWVARWLFGVRVRDPECTFALLRRSLFARIPVQCDGTFAPVEILAKANFLGAMIS